MGNSKKSKKAAKELIENEVETFDTVEETEFDTVVDTDFEDETLVEDEADDAVEIDENGKIVLPGPLKTVKAEAKKKEKVVKEKKEKVVKPFEGFNSKIFSNDLSVLSDLSVLLTVVHDTLLNENIESDFKISTFKNEFRISLRDLSALEFVEKMSEDDKHVITDMNAVVKPKFISLKIA